MWLTKEWRFSSFVSDFFSWRRSMCSFFRIHQIHCSAADFIYCSLCTVAYLLLLLLSEIYFSFWSYRSYYNGILFLAIALPPLVCILVQFRLCFATMLGQKIYDLSSVCLNNFFSTLSHKSRTTLTLQKYGSSLTKICPKVCHWAEFY